MKCGSAGDAGSRSARSRALHRVSSCVYNVVAAEGGMPPAIRQRPERALSPTGARGDLSSARAGRLVPRDQSRASARAVHREP